MEKLPNPGIRAFRLLEIVTVGFPFCAFKALTGVALTRTHLGPLGWMLIALGGLDLLFNVVGLCFAAANRESPLPVCTAQWFVTRARPRQRPWRQLGLSVDAMLAFTLVAVMIGFGWLAHLPSDGMHLWSASVVLNVLGAGLGRLAESLAQVGPSGAELARRT